MRVSSLMLLILQLGQAAFALNPIHEIDQYAHSAWTLRDSALSAYPTSIAQTRDGYLWLGTARGLVRFNGERFDRWQPPAGSALPGTSIVRLLGGRDGALWIGTTAGLARWKGGTLTHYAELAGQYVGALAEDRTGTIWAGTNAGLAGHGRLCAIGGARAHCAGGDGRLGRFVSSLYVDSRHRLWVGSATGLWEWTPERQRHFQVAPSLPEIHAIVEDAHGTLVVAVHRELKRVIDGRLTTFVVPGVGPRPNAISLLRDRDGALWIGTQDRGLLHVGANRVDRYGHTSGLSGDFVPTLFEDREGSVWVTTLNGLDRFRDLTVATLSAKQGLSADNVASVFAGRDGTLWIGTSGGLNRWRDGRIESGHASGVTLAEGSVSSVFEDSRGRLWLSSPRGLVYVHDGRVRPVTGVGRGYVHAIVEDRNGDLWVSDQDRGLLRLRDGNVIERTPWTAFGDRAARSMSADPVDGGVWLGFFQGGVAYVKDGRVERAHGEAEGLGGGAVTSLTFDADQTLWVATRGGLSRVHPTGVSTLSARNGLPCDIVHWAVEDHARTMWVYSACGLLRIDRASLERWLRDSSATLTPTVYDDAEGVWSHADVGSYGPKVTKTRDGRVWFATYYGVAVFDPANVPFNVVAPPVHVEQVTADRRTYDPRALTRLPPLVRDLRIDYAALSLAAPEKVRFRYKLEGRDLGWIDAGSRRQAFYTDLPPKTYRFRVIGSNNHGVWNEVGATLEFAIAPALYQRTAFTVGAAILGAAAAWLLYRRHLRRVAAQMNMRFEERLAERTRIAQELHDTVLQGFASASMQMHVLADEIAGHPVKPKLDQVLARVSHVIEEGRQTVYGLRAVAATDDLEQVLARDAEYFRGQQTIDIHVVVEGPRRSLRPLTRDEVYRICREALANAFRHARATRIDIEVQYAADFLQVSVRDNGRGIEREVMASGRPGHWGIHGMRERAERIGGSVRIWSGPKAGTEIELRVPAHFAFERNDVPHARRWLARWWRS